MTRTWVIADPHLSHGNICKFLRNDGSKLRPWDSAEEMDKALIHNWNELVQDGDRVYVLGDVVMHRKALSILYHLKGRKCLVKGNHDIFKLKDYQPYFDDIRAYVVGKSGEGRKYILSHIPLHPDSLGRLGINIHGHLHANSIADPRYVCVSMEQTQYAPILLQDALARAGSIAKVESFLAEQGHKKP
jgi:calcineurin-like phosphoesterase family protein